MPTELSLPIPFYNDWDLNVSLNWELKRGKYATIQCPKCNGHGHDTVFDMWGDGNTLGSKCFTCRGTGVLSNPNIEPKPTEPDDFKKELELFVKDYFIKHRDYAPIIKNAIDIQNDPTQENRFLYCIVTDLTGYNYNDSKKILHEYCLKGIIKCDSNFYQGTMLDILD